MEIEIFFWSPTVLKKVINRTTYNTTYFLIPRITGKGRSSVDTTLATFSLTRHLLVTLKSKMIDFDSNIYKFKVNIQELRNKLAQYGATSKDALVNLFWGYKQVKLLGIIPFTPTLFKKNLIINNSMTKALTAYQVVEKERESGGCPPLIGLHLKVNSYLLSTNTSWHPKKK